MAGKEIKSNLGINCIRSPWQLRVALQPDGRYEVTTNTFTLTNLTEETFAYAVTPFIGAGGQVTIDTKAAGDTEEESKRILELFMDLFRMQRRAVGFLRENHRAMIAYWHNILNTRQKHHVSGLEGIAKGKPVLFIGAGPSTGTNMAFIRKIIEAGTAFVVTGGTGIRILHDAGLVPHLCIAVDPFDREWPRFSNLSEEWMNKTVLVASTALSPIVYENWKGPLIAAEGLNCMSLGQVLEGAVKTFNEGRVGVSTWMPSIAEYMGAKEYWLIGVDLCYARTGGIYANGLELPYPKRHDVDGPNGLKTTTNWLSEAKDISEELTHSLNVFHKADLTKEEFEATQGKTRFENVYNCNYDGLPVPKVPNRDIRDLLKYPKIDTTVPLNPWEGKKQDLIQERALRLKADMEKYRRNLNVPGFWESDTYKHILFQYKVMADFMMWRTGYFPYTLLKQVLQSNVDIITSVLSGNKYEGEWQFDNAVSLDVNLPKEGEQYTPPKDEDLQ